MRYYGFGNFYLSSIQQGVQAFHGLGDMLVHYNRFSDFNGSALKEAHDNLIEWAANHKTVILKNGGNSEDLHELFRFLETGPGNYPFVTFREDRASLNNALTHVGIVLPEEIYGAADFSRTNRDPNVLRLALSDWKEELISRMNRCGLAS